MDDDIVSHMGFRPFDVAPAHSFEVRVEMIGANHGNVTLFAGLPA
ncbi:hypothetical protein [Sphingomonas sp. UYP23]